MCKNYLRYTQYVASVLLAVMTCEASWENTNLPDDHMPYYFTNNPGTREKCAEDNQCLYKEFVLNERCWGYETGCPLDQRLSNPSCPGESRGWAKSKESQLDQFWRSADFGYIKERRDELKMYCKPNTEEDSSLECAKFTRYCRAKNLYLDFTKANLKKGRDRFREDVFKEGDIGGHCDLDKNALKAEGDHKSALQSWFAEIEQFTSLPFRPVSEQHCDIIIDKPTYLMKLDAGVNLYHHFCDFINLYAAQHVNNSFSTDVYIIMWDTSPMMYRDFFEDTWKAFTDYPVIPLKDYDGKKVCFKEAVFSLLPRMRYGMYYNQPLEKIRITLLSRGTKYRNILNEAELLNTMKTVGEFEVRRVEYNLEMSFIEQMKISHNSDIFIGMHGAGLTHMLFQPDWAVVIELYNCEDAGCYYDLARSRGIKYMTWERKDKLHQQDEGHHPTLGAHAKFTNYGFDVQEFMRLIFTAADHVRNHPLFIESRNRKWGKSPPNGGKEEL